MNKYFNLYIEPKYAAPVFQGQINKDQMQPAGDHIPVHLQLGKFILPNYSTAWAKRLLGADKKPNGALEFLAWGADGGQRIALRWLPFCNSLDRDYQKNVLKLETDEDSHQIPLNPGLNEIEVDGANEMFILFLKHHGYFKGNVSRDPGNKTIKMYEYKPEEGIKHKKDSLRRKTEAATIVLNASENNYISVLASIFNLDGKKHDNVLEDELLDIIEKLAPDGINFGYDYFLSKITSTKDAIAKILAEAVEAEVLKGESKKEILLLMPDGKKKSLFNGELQEGDSTVDYIMDTILKTETYETFKLIEQTLKAIQKAEYQ